MEYIAIIGILVLDQITKYWIAHANLNGSIEIIRNFFYITYVKNTGAAWGMFSGKTVGLSLLAAVASGVLLYNLSKIRRKKMPWTKTALILMTAGALGNLLDRLVLGYVRDFLHFYPFGYDFPVFNVADIALTCGVVVLLIATFISEGDSKNA